MLLLFGVIVAVAQIFQIAELSYWPIVAALIGALIVIVARKDLSLPWMGRTASSVALVLLTLMMINVAIVWDRTLAVRQIVALSRSSPDLAYRRWKEAGARVDSDIRVKYPDIHGNLERADEVQRASDARQAQKSAALTQVKRAAEAKRRREEFSKSPLRRFDRYVISAFSWLLVHGGGKP